MAIDPNKSKKGKIALGLVHPQFLKSLALVSDISRQKGYPVLNWVEPETNCMFLEYLISAALRHIIAFQEGHDWNIEKDESGKDIELHCLHVESAAYNLLMLATLFRMGRMNLDDRKL